MSFGKNPHVAKAESEQMKAEVARDDIARERAWREAARQWDRAADKEIDAKRKQLYTANAEAARAQADGTGEVVEVPLDKDDTLAKDESLLN